MNSITATANELDQYRPAQGLLGLADQDANREETMAVLTEAYGAEGAELWFQRWRMFWMDGPARRCSDTPTARDDW